jgi:hypothetical protein
MAFVAVYLMQLKEMAENVEEAKTPPFELIFGPVEWVMLWKHLEKSKRPAIRTFSKAFNVANLL